MERRGRSKALQLAAIGGLVALAVAPSLLCRSTQLQLQFARLPASNAGNIAGASTPSSARGRSPRVARAVEVNEDEYIDIWDQSIQELALDVRELLITDANLFFIGPDMDKYKDDVAEVARLLNYSNTAWDVDDIQAALPIASTLEGVYAVPPLQSIQRWPWAVLRNGLTFWLDDDGYERWDANEKKRIRDLKVTKRKDPFGPSTPMRLTDGSQEAAADPIDMWQEGDVHVDMRDLEKADGSVVKLVLVSTINTILDNPPKWRGWFRQAKTRGTIPADYETPLQVRRAHNSYGVSPRLNRLLNA